MLSDIYIFYGCCVYFIHYTRIKFQSCLCASLSLSLSLPSSPFTCFLHCCKNTLTFCFNFQETEEQKNPFSSMFLNVCVECEGVCVSELIRHLHQYKLSNKWDPIWYYLSFADKELEFIVKKAILCASERVRVKVIENGVEREHF